MNFLTKEPIGLVKVSRPIACTGFKEGKTVWVKSRCGYSKLNKSLKEKPSEQDFKYEIEPIHDSTNHKNLQYYIQNDQETV